MERTIKQTKEKTIHNTSTRYILLPILLTLVVIPLCIGKLTGKSYVYTNAWYPNSSVYNDYSFYIKYCIFLLLVLYMLGNMGYHVLGAKKKIVTPYDSKKTFAWSFLPLVFYAGFVLLSAITSTNHQLTIHGMEHQYESILASFGYCICCFYTYVFARNTNQVKQILRALSIMLIGVIVVGLSQVLKFDLLNTSFIKAITQSKSVSSDFDGNLVYATLGNPNYVGALCALTIPIFVTLFIVCKNNKARLMNGLIALGLFIICLGSKSSSGLIGALFGLVALIIGLLIMYRKKIAQKKGYYVVGLLVLVITILVGNLLLQNPIGKKFTSIKNLVQTANEPIAYDLTEINTEKDAVYITFNNKKLSIQLVENNGNYEFIFTDENGNQLPYQISEDSSTVTLEDKAFTNLAFGIVAIDEYIAFELKADTKSWYFTNQSEDGQYYFCNMYGNLTKLNTTDDSKKYWTIGSGRGYIWDRTVSIIKQYPLLGVGPDNYVLYAPNSDYLNLYHQNFSTNVISKPHNIYLQIAANTGIPALLAYLAFLCIYIASSIRCYLQVDLKEEQAQIGLAFLVGIIGYIVAGLANDSIICVSPVFFILIGTGLAINRNIMGKKNESVS